MENLREFESRQGIDYVKDPIYKYIAFTRPYHNENEATERDLLDSPWVQRLRRIKQCQGTYSVYPGTDHARFQHSVGVMHLAGQFAREWYSRYFKVMSQKIDTSQYPKSYPSVEYVEEIFRIAGLCHDIGHGPFSHILDETYQTLELNITHEDISKWIIENFLRDQIKNIKRSPTGEFRTEEEIDPGMVSWLIKEEMRDYSTNEEFLWLRSLRSILTGLYSVDKLDYILRDAMFAGSLEYGQIDVERLRLTSFVTQSGLYLEQSSIIALRNMILARLDMYQSCYYHKTVRAFEYTAKELLPETVKLLNFQESFHKSHRDFLDKFFEFDECTLVEKAYRWRISENDKEKLIGQKWCNFFDRKIPWKLAYESPEILTSEPIFARLLGKFLLSEFKKEFWSQINELKSSKERHRSDSDSNEIAALQQISENDIWFDSPLIDSTPLNPLKDESAINIYDPILNKVREEGVRKILSTVPGRMLILRIYTNNKFLRKLVSNVANEVYKKALNPGGLLSHY